MNDPDATLLAAHAENDLAALITLYTQAADAAEAEDIDATCFFLTHAFIFALDLGDPRAAALNARLVAYGREVSL